MTDVDIDLVIASRRERRQAIRERIRRLEFASAPIVIDPFEELHGLIDDAKWLLEREESQRNAFLAYASSLVETLNKLHTVTRVQHDELKRVVERLSNGASVDFAVSDCTRGQSTTDQRQQSDATGNVASRPQTNTDNLPLRVFTCTSFEGHASYVQRAAVVLAPTRERARELLHRTLVEVHGLPGLDGLDELVELDTGEAAVLLATGEA